MKNFLAILLALVMVFAMAACSNNNNNTNPPASIPVLPGNSETPDESKPDDTPQPDKDLVDAGAVSIVFENSNVPTVNGEPITADKYANVYLAKNVFFFNKTQFEEENYYGEGTIEDAHTQAEANKINVITISQPGVYTLSGTATDAQIMINLGKTASNDPNACVRLVLDNFTITNNVAPAILVYSAYECQTQYDVTLAGKDYPAIGCSIEIKDGTTNTINGSYVAPIYDPDKLYFDATGTNFQRAEILHNYPGAISSNVTLMIEGNDGVLNINGERAGISAAKNIVLKGGVLNIEAETGVYGMNIKDEQGYTSRVELQGGTLNITAKIGVKCKIILTDGTEIHATVPDGGMIYDGFATETPSNPTDTPTTPEDTPDENASTPTE